ncbi:putative G-protein coupled receptor 179 [Microcaecilia unicolor]|uniref:Probable G-protein coupled receptor 179 n=1 Tax=Microcaecilia unicolor TaxID=1415580 RepID=A0A6P7ZAH1_9AMPH|nr:probable G-protein coupled receptor 179 [Microcaecilia unicolor]
MEVLLWNLLWCFQMELLYGSGILQRQRPLPRTRILKTKDTPPLSSSTSFPSPELDWMDPEGSEAAMAFLNSGDVPNLVQANCSQRFELWDLEDGPVESFHYFVRGAMDTLVQAANFLNMIFQTSDIRESSLREDVEWYHALVRSSIEGDSKIYRALLTFDAHPMSSKPQLILQAIKESNEILLQEVSMASDRLRNLSWDNEWFTSLKFQTAPSLHKTILSNDLKSLDTPKWNKGDSYVIDSSHIKWSTPFLECRDNKFVPSWMVTLSAAFYGLKPDLSPEFKGVMRLDVNLQALDINQCDSSRGWFTGTHQCDLNSTECVPQENGGFVLGRYLCLCKPGFYSTAETGTGNVSQYGAENASGLLQCRPCQEGCVTCVDDTPCLVQEDWSLRVAVLSFQTFCMLAVFLSMLVSYYFRSSKRIRASGVLLLETILFGSLLLYFPVFILYFKPSVFRCIVLRWVRMLGFAIVYGTITLKLYRVLKVFLSRTAQRVPYMTSGRVIRMLGVILLLVFWFLAAWTIGMLENIDRNIPLVVRTQTASGLVFYICDYDRWDYMMVVAELLFLFWGSFLCYATKTVPSAFHEPRYMGVALHNEMVISATFHVGRFIMVPSLHPDWTLLAFFIHTHVTVTITLALLFVPKFLHLGTSFREETAAEVYEDELDLRRSGSYLNSSITSAWSEHSLDPEDIRDELKKLYAQLEVHKTKRMTANNPHLQKKRSSRRGLGRSIMRRITEIPESVSRQCSREEKDGSIGGGGGSYPGSYKKKVFDSSSSSMKMREEPPKNKLFSLKKSHSTYDHVRDQENTPPSPPPCLASSSKDASLRDSLMRKKLAKKASQKSISDSIEDAPLVYKSASAHNLLTEKPLHPKPYNLQKSLSVITSAREKALLLTNKVCTVEDCSKQAEGEELRKTEEATTIRDMTLAVGEETHKDDGQAYKTAKQQKTNNVLEEAASSLLKDLYDKAEVCPWEVQDLPSISLEHKVHKHVTYAPIICSGVDRSHQSGKPQNADTLPDTGPAPSHPEDTAPPFKHLIQGLCLEETKDLPTKTKSIEAHDRSKPELKKEDYSDLMQCFSSCPAKVTPATAHSFPAELCPWENEVPGTHSSNTSSSLELTCSNMPNTTSAKQSCREPSHKNTLKSFVLAMRALKGSPTGKGSSYLKGRKEKEESEGNHQRDTNTRNGEAKRFDPEVTPTAKAEQMSKQETNKTSSELPGPCPPGTRDINKQNTNSSKMYGVYPWEENVKIDVKSSLPSHGKVGRKTERGGSAEAGIYATTRKMVKLSSNDPKESTGLRNQSSVIFKTSDSIDIKKDEICPWESMEAQKSLGQLSKCASTAATENYKTSNTLDRMDKKRDEICPWKTAEVEVCFKADICPWETSKAPKGEESTVLRQLENFKSQQETIHPWKIMGSQQFLETISKSESKTFDQGQSIPKKSESNGSKRGGICSWESLDYEDLPRTLSKSTSDTWEWCKAISKESSNREEVCPWKSIDGAISIKNEMHPWEMEDRLPIKMEAHIKGTISKLPSSNSQKSTSKQETVNSWKSEDLKHLTKTISKSEGKMEDLYFSASHTKCLVRKRTNSLNRNVCPWETKTTATTIKNPRECSEEDPVLSPSTQNTAKNQILDANNQVTKEIFCHHKVQDDVTGAKQDCKELTRHSEVCPCEPDVTSASSTVTQSKAAVATADNANIPKPTKRPEVCPWDFE